MNFAEKSERLIQKCQNALSFCSWHLFFLLYWIWLEPFTRVNLEYLLVLIIQLFCVPSPPKKIIPATKMEEKCPLLLMNSTFAVEHVLSHHFSKCVCESWSRHGRRTEEKAPVCAAERIVLHPLCLYYCLPSIKVWAEGYSRVVFWSSSIWLASNYITL